MNSSNEYGTFTYQTIPQLLASMKHFHIKAIKQGRMSDEMYASFLRKKLYHASLKINCMTHEQINRLSGNYKTKGCKKDDRELSISIYGDPDIMFSN